MSRSPKPSDPERRHAGRSADARGDTGTAADTPPGRGTGGIPGTADAGVADAMGLPPERGGAKPMDRDRPTPAPQGGAQPAAAAPASRDDPGAGGAQDDGAPDTLGTAPAAPNREAVERRSGGGGR